VNKFTKKPYQSAASGHYTLTSRTVEASAMPTARVRTVLGHISQLVGTPPAGDLTDGQLLQRYTSDREKAAFTALLQRHGRLVWRVCRHVLHHDQDAEDAFQATFLVLAHKAKLDTQTGVGSQLALRRRLPNCHESENQCRQATGP